MALPFVLDNAVNLAALAHAWRGEGRGRSGFVVLALGTGIGAAIVADGRLLRGRRSGAGEVGYLVVDRAQLRGPRPGGIGALEAIASGPALVAEAARLGVPAEVAATPEAVLRTAAAGDPQAAAVARDLVDHVAMTLIAVAATTDPELVVLDGTVGVALEPWLDALRDLVARHLPFPPALAISSLGTEATALGAVAAALQLARKRGAPGPYADTLTVGAGPEPVAARTDVA